MKPRGADEVLGRGCAFDGRITSWMPIVRYGRIQLRVCREHYELWLRATHSEVERPVPRADVTLVG